MILTRKCCNGNTFGSCHNIRYRVHFLRLNLGRKDFLYIRHIGCIKNSSVESFQIEHTWGRLLCHLQSHIRHHHAMCVAGNIRIRHWKNINTTVEILLEYAAIFVRNIIRIFPGKIIIINTSKYIEFIFLRFMYSLVDSREELTTGFQQSHCSSYRTV